MIPNIKKKQPWEKLNWTLDASNLIQTGDSISEVDIDVFDNNDTDVTSTMISGTPSASGTDISVTVQAGTDGEDYNLRCRITTTNGEQLEDDLTIEVRDDG